MAVALPPPFSHRMEHPYGKQLSKPAENCNKCSHHHLLNQIGYSSMILHLQKSSVYTCRPSKQHNKHNEALYTLQHQGILLTNKIKRSPDLYSRLFLKQQQTKIS